MRSIRQLLAIALLTVAFQPLSAFNPINSGGPKGSQGTGTRLHQQISDRSGI